MRGDNAQMHLMPPPLCTGRPKHQWARTQPQRIRRGPRMHRPQTPRGLRTHRPQTQRGQRMHRPPTRRGQRMLLTQRGRRKYRMQGGLKIAQVTQVKWPGWRSGEVEVTHLPRRTRRIHHTRRIHRTPHTRRRHLHHVPRVHAAGPLYSCAQARASVFRYRISIRFDIGFLSCFWLAFRISDKLLFRVLVRAV